MAFLHLLLLSATAAEPRPTAQARASIRILRPATVNERSWREADRRSERIVREPDGRISRLLIIDFE